MEYWEKYVYFSNLEVCHLKKVISRLDFFSPLLHHSSTPILAPYTGFSAVKLIPFGGG